MAGSAQKGIVDVDDEITTLLKFDNGAIGSLEATRNAWGRNNFITLEIHGEIGSIYFNYERRDELQVCFANDPADRKGFRTIYTGPAHPNGAALFGRSRRLVSDMVKPKSSSAMISSTRSSTTRDVSLILKTVTASLRSATPSSNRPLPASGPRLAADAMARDLSD